MLKLDIQHFAFSGTGKAKRESAIVLMNVGDTTEEYEAIGKDNDELSRTLNNEVEQKNNVLGETETEVTKAPQTTTVDPFKFRRDSKIASKLYDIYKNDKELDDVIEEFVEVFTEDKVAEGEYGAFKQKGAIDLKSWGGDTKGVNAPFDINWCGAKTHGTFNPTTKKFTPTTSTSE